MDEPSTQKDLPIKKPFSDPRLVEYGNLETLTRGNAHGTNSDSKPKGGSGAFFFS